MLWPIVPHRRLRLQHPPAAPPGARWAGTYPKQV